MKFSTASIKATLVLAIVMFFSVTFLGMARADVYGLRMGDTIADLENIGIKCTQITEGSYLYGLSAVPKTSGAEVISQFAAVIHPRLGIVGVYAFVFDVKTAPNGATLKAYMQSAVAGLAHNFGRPELITNLPSEDYIEISNKSWMEHMLEPDADYAITFTDFGMPGWPEDILFVSVDIKAKTPTSGDLTIIHAFKNTLQIKGK